MSQAEKGRKGPPPSRAERAYLLLGLNQPGRKLPLFDAQGQPVRPDLIRSCIARGWAERWFSNPLAPDWLVCRLTDRGARAVLGAAPGVERAEEMDIRARGA